MVALRSRRLEAILGATLDALTPAHIRSLVEARLQEDFDLDFKRDLYGRSDDDKRKLATDVAAMANSAGGVIILGVEEDDHAQAVKAPGVAVSDTEISRIYQVVASQVAPHSQLDVISMIEETPNEKGESTGFLVIAVPRSPAAPHAVPVNNGLRYPRRNGTTTRYLTEPEVATAYRDRLALLQDQQNRAVQIEQEAIDRLDTSETPWIVVSLVPDLPGDVVLSHRLVKEWEQQIRQERPTLLSVGLAWARANVGHRKLLADGAHQGRLAKWASLEAHCDGSGVCSLRAMNMREREPFVANTPEKETSEQLALDEHVAINVMSGLKILASHARDRAAAGGTALLRAQIYPVSSDQPLAIGHLRSFGGSRSPWLVSVPPPPATAAAQLDDIAEFGPSLVSAAAILIDELGQGYGVPEMGQLTRDGRVRRRYWNQGIQGQVVALCQQHDVEVTDEVI